MTDKQRRLQPTPFTMHASVNDPELVAHLEEELTAYNASASGLADEREYSVSATDAAGELVGGITGWTWGPSAGIELLWVREDARRTGCGTDLLAAAEELVRRRGCTRLYVSTYSFQAPLFYLRHGFVECARVPDLPLAGMADVHLLKQLDGPP